MCMWDSSRLWGNTAMAADTAQRNFWDQCLGVSPRSETGCARILSWPQLTSGLVMLLYSGGLGQEEVKGFSCGVSPWVELGDSLWFYWHFSDD